MWRMVAIVLIGVICFGVTGPKIVKMFQIKGIVQGADIKEKVVINKDAEDEIKRYGNISVYWISWEDDSIDDMQYKRINVTKEKWDSISIGDTVEVVYVLGDKSPYLRDGIFVDVGNFIFDFVLFLIEIVSIVILLIGLFKNRKLKTI